MLEPGAHGTSNQGGRMAVNGTGRPSWLWAGPQGLGWNLSVLSAPLGPRTWLLGRNLQEQDMGACVTALTSPRPRGGGEKVRWVDKRATSAAQK